MNKGILLLMAVFSMSLLAGCASDAKPGAVQSFSSAVHEKKMVDEMNLHRAGKTGARAASRQDNAALRETLATHPVRSNEAQSSEGTVNEMVEGEGLPRPTEQSRRQSMAQSPTVIEERTVVIVPVEPVPGETMARSDESRLGPQDRSDQEVALRRDAESLPPGAELAEITRYEPDFRQNYESNFANTGYGYDQYRPAYRYGFELAKDPRYDGMDWKTLEMQAHRNWNEGTMGPWNRYKDAVRYGWERGREATPGRG
jgi:outer membrane murein-binding lipoprotein Lpp